MPLRRPLFGLTLVAMLALLAATGYAWTRDDAPGDSGTASAVERGRNLFLSKGCAGCHHLSREGIIDGYGTGPDLSGLPDAAGQRVEGQSAEEYVRTSILNPDAYYAPGYSSTFGMPQLALTADEVDALIAFLLDEG